MNKLEEPDMRKYIQLNKKDNFITELHEELIRERQIINEKIKEIERLNNIINELEENMKDYVNMIEEGISHNTEYIYLGSVYQFLNNQLDKLQELKGDGSNE